MKQIIRCLLTKNHVFVECEPALNAKIAVKKSCEMWKILSWKFYLVSENSKLFCNIFIDCSNKEETYIYLKKTEDIN